MSEHMTARPMTEGERAEALEAAKRIVEAYDDFARKPKYRRYYELSVYKDTANADAVTVARALLSTSAAVRGMREALKEARRYLDAVVANSGSSKRRENYAGAVRRIDAALSLIEGEDEQARPSGSAPISTDTKGTTK